MDDRFLHTSYVIRKKIFVFFGGAFHIYDPNGRVVFYSRLKAFKLKEDIRLYTGEDMQHEILSIQARQILDIAATYDVIDSTTHEKVGALKRSLKSAFFRDEWVLLDAQDREVGRMQEESQWLALVRRVAGSFLFPQTFIGTVNGTPVFTFKQHFNPFVLRIALDFSKDTHRLLDRRLGIAAAVLLCAIEGRQSKH